MRITNSMMVNRMMMNMNRNMSRMDKLYNDYASGKRIHRPSDDPVLVARSLKIHTDIAENDQFKRNVDDAYSILDKTETSLRELNNILHRVRDLTTQASNGVLTPEDTMKIQSEVKQIKEQIIKISNDTYVGRHIFSGYRTDEPYLNENGTNAVNLDKEIRSDGLNLPVNIPASPNNKFKLNITGLVKSDGTKYTGEYTVQLPNKSYDGTTNTLEDLKNDLQNALNSAVPADYKNFEVKLENNQIVIKNPKIKDSQKFAIKSDTLDLKNLGFEKLNISQSTEKIDYNIGISASISINIRGDEVFGPVVDSDNDNIPDKTLMDTMNELIGLLEKGDNEEISKKLDEIDTHMNNISRLRATVGARTNTVETIRNRIEDTKINFTKLLSETEDTDMAEVSMQFMMADSIYKASLNIGARIIQPSLVDFIR
ncbi:flagellar hook-associated protein FlgL [Tepidibacter thalassicus]|uniref:Flagellar hook-associated protein 3 FlgL n=1 Tax=Tepidibacter thalassicus DSM 15285 TaxID=1123350 RepID=A0A1M5R222_9FIRM|nr:flagellar hook-associated protein FlgL [Tepidibacter thalassicus]SHH20100.1 flagellar hook-associated protein 3 FlgL [Tepidibacter thalassicus DSM 15285]